MNLSITVSLRTRQMQPLRFTLYWLAVVVAFFNALSAVGGGLGMLLTGGLGMPEWFLATGPFRTFTIPALLLLVVVGGTQTVSAVLLLARRESSLLWTAVAGLGMVIWVAAELAIVEMTSWLQVVYLATGIVQLVVVLALLGIVQWLPRVPVAAASRLSSTFTARV